MEIKNNSNSDSTPNLYTVMLPNPNPGESSIYRHPNSKEALFLCDPKFDTVLKVFENRCSLNNGKCVFAYTPNSDIESLYSNRSYTFEQMRSISIQYASLVLEKNLVPDLKFGEKTYRFVGIYAKNCPEWLMVHFGNMYNDVTTVSIYDTLGLDGIEYILKLTKLTTLAVQLGFLEKILGLIKEGKNSNLKNLIVISDRFKNKDKNLNTRELTQEIMKTSFPCLENSVNFFYMDEIINSTNSNEINTDNFKNCTTDSIYIISFTSGSTGIPKGAMCTHKGIVNEGFSVLNSHNLDLEEGIEKHFSYLPYAHIFENVFMIFSLIRGMSTYYTNGDVRIIATDFLKAEPTFIIAVPRILLRFYDAVRGIIDSKCNEERNLINNSIREKLEIIKKEGNYSHRQYDEKIFNPIRMKLFGPNKLKFILVGSAPIDSEVLDFFKVICGCPIIEAYGMTEEHGALSCTDSKDPISGHVGGCITAMEFKLVDVPELNYLTTDKNSNNQLEPRGEIYARGNCVFAGYLDNEEETKNTLDPDGWIRSGDIGVMVNNEKLKIIDRIKNIFKLSQGEYIAPEKVENVMKLSKYAVQSYVYGISTHNYIVALIVVDKLKMEKLSNELNVKFENHDELLENHNIKETVLKEIIDTCKKQKLNGFEIPQKIIMTYEMFTIENGLLTTTMKAKRHELRKRWEDLLKKLY